MFEAETIRSISPAKKCFSLGQERLGVSGSYVKLDGLNEPLFLKGEFSEWLLFKSTTVSIFVLASKAQGVYRISASKENYSSWRSFWVNYEAFDEWISFYGYGHPLEGSSPDQVKISCKTGNMMAADYSTMGDIQFDHVVKQSLTLHEL